jgi:hypothetical protein
MNIRKFVRPLLLHSPFIPLLLFAVLIFSFIQVYRHSSLKPHIISVNPSAALPGELLLIRGTHFGEFHGDSEVIIAGIRPTKSAYRSWSDEEISLVVPDDVGSGRIFVFNRNGRSNGVLFTNKGHIPVILEGPSMPGVPYIESISPDGGFVGTEIVLKGMNFGFERQESVVSFTFFSGAENEKREGDDADNNIECSPLDFDYLFWSDQEVRVKVPDGASSGGVVLLTNRGESNSVYFEVGNPVGTKRYPRMKGYQVSYGVEISQVSSTGVGAMDLWIPAISKSTAQRNIEGIFEPEPMWKDFNGTMRYHISEFDPWSTYTFDLTYWFDRYSIETDINERSVPAYKKESQLYRRYTEATALFPHQESIFASTASRYARANPSPYAAARALYRHLIDNMEYSGGEPARSVTDALSSGRGDAYDYAMVYVTLCRAAGIPARPVAGFIVHGDKRSRKHFWAEFYIENFGWIPVDPALGDGLPIGDIAGVDNRRDYYFGNLDNQHIVFSRGLVELRPVDPQSRVVRYERNYSLQTIHEEYSRTIDRYRSLWKELEVTGWW